MKKRQLVTTYKGLGVRGNGQKLMQIAAKAGIKPGYYSTQQLNSTSDEVGLFVTPKGKEAWDNWEGKDLFPPIPEKPKRPGPDNASSSTGWVGRGVGVAKKSQPISTRYPAAVEAILRDGAKIRDRHAYIRAAVLQKLKEDGLIQ
jgi:hypothetical protein